MRKMTIIFLPQVQYHVSMGSLKYLRKSLTDTPSFNLSMVDMMELLLAYLRRELRLSLSLPASESSSESEKSSSVKLNVGLKRACRGEGLALENEENLETLTSGEVIYILTEEFCPPHHHASRRHFHFSIQHVATLTRHYFPAKDPCQPCRFRPHPAKIAILRLILNSHKTNSDDNKRLSGYCVNSSNYTFLFHHTRPEA